MVRRPLGGTVSPDRQPRAVLRVLTASHEAVRLGKLGLRDRTQAGVAAYASGRGVPAREQGVAGLEVPDWVLERRRAGAAAIT